MARIIVAGYMVRLPFVGNMLAYAQYVSGFERLGHKVMYIETSGWPYACYDPTMETFSDDPTPGLLAVDKLLKKIGVAAKVAYVDDAAGGCYGVSWREVKEAIAKADLLINVGGVCWLPEFDSCGRRALIDMDPFFTQAGKFAGDSLDRYHTHFSYGTNIGAADCAVPTKGIEWKPLVPTVVPELWREHHGADQTLPNPPCFTTIANWAAYGSVKRNGKSYGQKDESFAMLVDLPRLVDVVLKIAASAIPVEDKRLFETKGWHICSGAEVSLDWPRYWGFVSGSSGEFSAAKHGYVASRCGWISDRTVSYLAAGRPAIVQDTSIPHQVIARSEGFLVFATVEEAADKIGNVTTEYDRHRQAALDLADTVFSYKVTLPNFLEKALQPTKGVVAPRLAGPDCDVHLSIRNEFGSVEHYFHFILGFLLPLIKRVKNLDQRERKALFYVRSCAVMDQIIREIDLANIVILSKEELRDLSGAEKSPRGLALRNESLRGFDNPIRYDRKIFREAAGHLRNCLLEKVAVQKKIIEERFGRLGPRAVFINRASPNPFYSSNECESKTSGTQRRSIPNFHDLARAVTSAGYTVITCTLEGMTLASQIALFETADIIIAQHGAALVNLIWAREDIDVIEILPQDTRVGRHCFKDLAYCLRQNHHTVDQESAHSEVDTVRLMDELEQSAKIVHDPRIEAKHS